VGRHRNRFSFAETKGSVLKRDATKPSAANSIVTIGFAADLF